MRIERHGLIFALVTVGRQKTQNAGEWRMLRENATVETNGARTQIVNDKGLGPKLWCWHVLRYGKAMDTPLTSS
jgi:hypothetical protein